MQVARKAKKVRDVGDSSEKKMEMIYFPPEQEVHIYAGQKLNFYEF